MKINKLYFLSLTLIALQFQIKAAAPKTNSSKEGTSSKTAPHNPKIKLGEYVFKTVWIDVMEAASTAGWLNGKGQQIKNGEIVLTKIREDILIYSKVIAGKVVLNKTHYTLKRGDDLPDIEIEEDALMRHNPPIIEN